MKLRIVAQPRDDHWHRYVLEKKHWFGWKFVNSFYGLDADETRTRALEFAQSLLAPEIIYVEKQHGN